MELNIIEKNGIDLEKISQQSSKNILTLNVIREDVKI